MRVFDGCLQQWLIASESLHADRRRIIKSQSPQHQHKLCAKEHTSFIHTTVANLTSTWTPLTSLAPPASPTSPTNGLVFFAVPLALLPVPDDGIDGIMDPVDCATLMANERIDPDASIFDIDPRLTIGMARMEPAAPRSPPGPAFVRGMFRTNCSVRLHHRASTL